MYLNDQLLSSLFLTRRFSLILLLQLNKVHLFDNNRYSILFVVGKKKRRVRNESSVLRNGCSSIKSCIELVEQDDKNDDNQMSVVTAALGSNFSSEEEFTMKTLPGSFNKIIPRDRKHRRTFSWQQCRKKKRLRVAELTSVSIGELRDKKIILPAEHQCNMKFISKEVSTFIIALIVLFIGLRCCLTVGSQTNFYNLILIYLFIIFYHGPFTKKKLY